MEKKLGWGGRRPGAGRPAGSTKKEIRTNRTLKAFDYEWDAIRAFAGKIKKMPETKVQTKLQEFLNNL